MTSRDANLSESMELCSQVVSDTLVANMVLIHYQGNVICPDGQVESLSLANTMSELPLEKKLHVGQHCLGCSTSQSVRDMDSGHDGEWVFVRASYIRAVWRAHAALMVVIVLCWVVVNFYSTNLCLESGMDRCEME